MTGIPDDRYIQVKLADVWLRLDQKHGFVLGTSTTPFDDTAVYTVTPKGEDGDDEMAKKEADANQGRLPREKKSQVGPPHLTTPKGETKQAYWGPDEEFDAEDRRHPVPKAKDEPRPNPELGGSPDGIRQPIDTIPDRSLSVEAREQQEQQAQEEDEQPKAKAPRGKPQSARQAASEPELKPLNEPQPYIRRDLQPNKDNPINQDMARKAEMQREEPQSKQDRSGHPHFKPLPEPGPVIPQNMPRAEDLPDSDDGKDPADAKQKP